jgi:cysteinyl-tRNA synthetase
MTIHLYNTLTKQKEEFKPIESGKVGMYHCGPTVYNYAHIGNIRAYIFTEILRSALEYSGLEVKQVMNITDFGHLTDDADSGDDKMTIGLKRENLPVSMEGLNILANKYSEAFVKDLESLNIKLPHVMPRATDHIPEYIELIKNLEAKGLTYATENSLYFDTTKIENYGKLGGLSESQDSRIGENTEKKNPRDFALWKFNEKFGWESPWGHGFPGWHIECSGMSHKYLGETFDIHTGGIDHIPVHHNNEIAQSESAHGKEMAHVWMHNAFININGDKVAKSTGNVAYVNDFKEAGIHPLAYRYWVLQSHYRTTADYTTEAVLASQTAFERLLADLVHVPDTGSIIPEYKADFIAAIEDDLNTPQAIALIWVMMKSDSDPADIKATILEFDKVLGLNISQILEKNLDKLKDLPQHIQTQLKLRTDARDNKDWSRSDEIRDNLLDHEYVVEDTPEGQRIRPKTMLS